MNIKEIVYCYVSETITTAIDFGALRESFVCNGYKERQVSEDKWIYKRGAAFGLEFNYNSESLQVHVIIERVGSGVKVSVGNWGFPFEPLMMKPRFQEMLKSLVSEISNNGKLLRNEAEESRVAKKGARIKNLAYSVLVVGFVTYVIISSEVFRANFF